MVAKNLKRPQGLTKHNLKAHPYAAYTCAIQVKILSKTQEEIHFFFTIFYIIHISIFSTLKIRQKFKLQFFLVSEQNPCRGPPGVVFCHLQHICSKTVRLDTLKNIKKMFTTLHPGKPMAKPQFAFQLIIINKAILFILTITT